MKHGKFVAKLGNTYGTVKCVLRKALADMPNGADTVDVHSWCSENIEAFGNQFIYMMARWVLCTIDGTEDISRRMAGVSKLEDTGDNLKELREMTVYALVNHKDRDRLIDLLDDRHSVEISLVIRQDILNLCYTGYEKSFDEDSAIDMGIKLHKEYGSAQIISAVHWYKDAGGNTDLVDRYRALLDQDTPTTMMELEQVFGIICFDIMCHPQMMHRI